ncbi:MULTISPECIES: class I adenylate-forming enzyme family protein [Brenneria]|uniref:Long-chain fatty acid--CoA ligase n=1 Tax=Brenneria nigrifluens DSM 30175 = ATCC 13028 TaxID=1121120 RepID=A0A2U1UPE5_9GAMM|nr:MULTISPECIES: class I adenylate-forming enzyme family protein [Brenneria]EHD23253.1 o-succinylbenzoate--CoA ligase [Brenneria sp. EniD312]PWC23507.1 long-chain fatty acid--CoA ligase [Brenneria nigrifluens DSM 30175 = ATCC 13028]QCR06186.1 long-chain fatty acid--CoA ligase [Brenneria nigrifluens DSM 30175 = ATCC 13028]
MNTFSSFRKHALLHSNETAVKSKNRDISFYDLLILIQWIETELKSEKIKQGDRISIHMGNSIELIAAYYACLKVGAIFVPLSLKLSPKEVKNLIQHSSSRAYIGDITRFNEAKKEIESCKSLEKKWIIDIDKKNETNLIHTKENMSLLSYEDPAENITTDTLASIFYTSGTTGTPKGIVYSQKTLIEAINLTKKTINPKPSKAGEACPVILSLVDLISPWSILITLAALHKGYSVLLLSESDINNIIETLKETKPAWIAGTPSNFQSIINIVDQKNTSLDLSETVCVAGGDSCATELSKKFFEYFGSRLQSSYGQTELGGPVVYHHDLCAIDNPSIGWPLPGVEIKINDTQSDNGELFIRSPARTIGIWNGNDIDRFPNDRWLATGDIVRKSNDGSFFFLGREKDQIKIEGYPVYPIEIEQTLIQHDGIADAVVFSIPDSFAGERIIALIQMKKDCSPDAENIIAYLSDHLSHYKHPSEYIFIRKTPIAVTGKISRRRLSNEYNSLKNQAEIYFNVRDNSYSVTHHK